MQPLYESPPYTYDVVLFSNDVFSCASDMISLLSHKADIACGLDFIQDENNDYIFYDKWVSRDEKGNAFIC